MLNKFRDELRLIDYFNFFYETVHATSEKQKEETYNIRYQVYCIENGYEQPENLSHPVEKDRYDKHSCHSILKNKLNNSNIGSVRLILPHDQDYANSFPIQQACSEKYFKNFDFQNYKPAEASRFCISKKLRQGLELCIHDWAINHGTVTDITNHKKQAMSIAILGLLRALIEMSLKNSVTHWFAIMEPSLIRLFTKINIYFIPIGEKVEYHGIRQPCYIELDELFESTFNENRQVWEVLTNDGKILTESCVPSLPETNRNSFSKI